MIVNLMCVSVITKTCYLPEAKKTEIHVRLWKRDKVDPNKPQVYRFNGFAAETFATSGQFNSQLEKAGI